MRKTNLPLVLTVASIIAISSRPVATAATPQDTPAPAPAAQPPLDPQVEKILDRLTQREVRDIQARVTWELGYSIEEDDDQQKLGKIWYLDDEPVARFLVVFDAKVARNRRYDWTEKHLFDGRWYVEQQEKGKTFTKREMRRPDESFNPYKLGEGPFPVPFGQNKDDIVREFEVALVPPAKSDPADTTHLKLTPRANTVTGESYKTIDFWVLTDGSKLDGLPIKVRANKKSPTGQSTTTITVTFDDIQLSQGISRALFQLEPPPGYHVTVEPLPSARTGNG